MSWNHRVLRHVYSDGTIEFAIHEVYYDNDAADPEAGAWGPTENPVAVRAESLEGLRWVLEEMLRCLDKPALKLPDAANEGASYSAVPP
jgi:hypothetical protein